MLDQFVAGQPIEATESDEEQEDTGVTMNEDGTMHME
jgi:hypothetical protein